MSIQRAGRRRSSRLPQEALAARFCEVLLAFARNDCADRVDWLVQVRQFADRCGSLAQFDLVHLTFIERPCAHVRTRLARSLVAEREAEEPASLLDQLLRPRMLTMSAAAKLFGSRRPSRPGQKGVGAASEIVGH
jgi:hypothetical protein